MNPTAKRFLTGLAGVACVALTFTIFKTPGAVHDELLKNGRELLGVALGTYLLGGASLNHHNDGSTTLLGWVVTAAKDALSQQDVASSAPTQPGRRPMPPPPKKADPS